MIYIHSTIRITAGNTQAYVEARREHWLPYIQEDGMMRLIGFWQTAHGGGAMTRRSCRRLRRGWRARDQTAAPW